MTGTSIQRFDTWFGNNYNVLIKYCKRYRIEEEILHDVYINVHDRITRSGFTENYFMTYVKRSIRNLRINNAKKLNGKYWIDYDNEDFTDTIEGVLQDKDETERDDLKYREDVIYFSKMLFKYIESQKYDDEYQFVFRCYYLMEGRMTYSKLNVMTGFNKNYCTKIIQTIKKDIRENFLTWLKNDTTRSNRLNGQAKECFTNTTV